MNFVCRNTYSLAIRMPEWANQSKSYYVKINGKRKVIITGKGSHYLHFSRKWKKGDVVEVHFDMLPRIVKANPKVEADRGRVAVERGPIVYCAEWPDNRFNVHSVLLNQHPQFKVTEKPELLYGINQLTTDAQALSYDMAGKLVAKDVELTLIPYYAWAHRGEGDMEVWLPIDVSATSTQLQEAGVWEDNGFFKN